MFRRSLRPWHSNMLLQHCSDWTCQPKCLGWVRVGIGFFAGQCTEQADQAGQTHLDPIKAAACWRPGKGELQLRVNRLPTLNGSLNNQSACTASFLHLKHPPRKAQGLDPENFQFRRGQTHPRTSQPTDLPTHQTPWHPNVMWPRQFSTRTTTSIRFAIQGIRCVWIILPGSASSLNVPPSNTVQTLERNGINGLTRPRLATYAPAIAWLASRFPYMPAVLRRPA